MINIYYFQIGVALLAPLNPLAETVCRQIERYLDDPGFPLDIKRWLLRHEAANLELGTLNNNL